MQREEDSYDEVVVIVWNAFNKRPKFVEDKIVVLVLSHCRMHASIINLHFDRKNIIYGIISVRTYLVS